MCPSLYVCIGMVAELVLGHLTPIMRPRTSSGGLGYSSDLFGQPHVPNGGHFGVRVSSCHTHRMRGGPTSGGGPLCVIKSFSRAVFCAVPSTTGRPPTIGHSQS